MNASVYAPLTSALAAMFATFEVIEVETEIVTVPFRQRYLDAEAAAELIKKLKSRPTASNLILYRI